MLKKILNSTLLLILILPPGVRAATVDQALAARQDVWGLEAMHQSNGPSYEFFAGLLPPLRYVNARFKVYPLVLCAPGSLQKARLVADGSTINARGGIETWRDIGLPAHFFVGTNDAPFGEQPGQLTGPVYERGYLPIVQISYRYGAQVYTEETFAAVEPQLAEHAVLLTQFGLKEGRDGVVTIRFETNSMLLFSNHCVLDEHRKIWAWCDKNWKWDTARRCLTATVSTHHTATVAIAATPLDAPPHALDYAAQKRKCAARWDALLAETARVTVPETVVNDAWKSAIVGSFLLLKGDHMNYGADTSYEQMFEAECGDVVRALAVYGLTNEAKTMIPPLLDYAKEPGLQFHDAGFKLQMLADYYWLTRDAKFVREQRPRWSQAVDKILHAQRSPEGLLPRELSDGDNNRYIDSLSSNANAARGLRDIAEVLEDMGEGGEAAPIRAAADALRMATLGAVRRSIRFETQPPFVPLGLFGQDQAYQILTASRFGSYWDLMINYVLGSELFENGSEPEGWIVHFLEEHGGLCMGMMRISQHSGLFANDDAVDDLYTLRYADTLLRRDEPDRALAGFYGKLAQGMTRGTYISAEGTGLRPLDEFGRPMYLPPTCSGNGYFLHLLRNLLVQEYDQAGDGKPDTLRLLYATPRRWLEDGKIINVENAPTDFGPMSLRVTSKLSHGEVVAEVNLPQRNPARYTFLRIRLPEGWQITSAHIGKEPLVSASDWTVDFSGLKGKQTIRFKVKHQ